MFRSLFLAFAFVLVGSGSLVRAAPIDFAAMTLNGSASRDGSDIVLTTSNSDQAGSAFISSPIGIDGSSGFSAAFEFSITNPQNDFLANPNEGGDGLTFTVHNDTAGATALGTVGGGLGYAGLDDSVAVEFDTWNGGPTVDPNDNHVGINTYGSMASLVTAEPGVTLQTTDSAFAWVDYDGSSLEVFFNTTAVKPSSSLLSSAFDLTNLGDSAFFGFTAATGGGTAEHRIKSFELDVGIPSPVERHLSNNPVIETPLLSLSSTSETSNSQTPIIVITHGWQPDGEFGVTEPEFLSKTRDQIQTELSRRGIAARIVTIDWQDAYTDVTASEIINALSAIPADRIPSVGVSLADNLIREFGAGAFVENGPAIHFIGHSFGTLVNAYAAEKLARFGGQIESMSVLDAPTLLPGVPKSLYTNLAENPQIGLVDNYYGKLTSGAVGQPIDGAFFENGFFLPDANHSDVWKIYNQSVSAANELTGGFYYSPALGNQGGYEAAKLLNGEPSPSYVFAPFETAGSTAPSRINSTSVSIFDKILGPSLILNNSSDGYAVFDVVFPSGFDSFVFDIEYLFGGSDDWLEVSFNNELLLALSGRYFLDGVTTLFADISRFSGQSGELTFLLASNGEEDVSLRISNLGFYGDEISVAAVPLPSSAWLLLSAIIFLSGASRLRMRPRNCVVGVFGH